MWFQQDGSTSHTANATIKLFPDKVISKNGHVSYPPRWPDLTAPYFLLWGYVKSIVYANQPQTLQQLKQNIRNEINVISGKLLKMSLKELAFV